MKTINLNATVKTKCFNGKYDETMWFLMAVEGDIIEVETTEGMVLCYSSPTCRTLN